MARGKQKDGFSILPEDGVDGGGVNGALATLTEIGWVEEFTYGGKFDPAAALYVKYDVDGLDKPWDDNFTAGPSENYEVVGDGDGIRSTNKTTGLNKKSGAYFFIGHLVDAIKASDLDIDDMLPEIEGEGVRSVRPLEGRRVRLAIRPFTNYSGETKDKAVIVEFVDDAPAKNGKTTKGNGKVAKSSGDDVDEKTETAILALLEDKSPIKKANIGNEVYAANKKDVDARAMMQLCLKDAWVFSDDRPWDSDRKKGTISTREED